MCSVQKCSNKVFLDERRNVILFWACVGQSTNEKDKLGFGPAALRRDIPVYVISLKISVVFASFKAVRMLSALSLNSEAETWKIIIYFTQAKFKVCR